MTADQERRPDPDELLARVQAEAAQAARGRLKVFFGASAGVGKTYAMLEEAHQRKADGVDVVVGYVETHGRKETEALLQGLELLPRRASEYRAAVLQEFDLDAALARRPQLILVDELAHTNAPGSRHPKRWQDVEELLDAGINVYTTVNVQHLESLNDVVAQITGVVVRETVPDRLLEMADYVELIDLTPDDLLQRLSEGKVYRPQQAERAARNFFRKGNLHALRELALRQTADRVDAQMRDYRRDHNVTETWPARERLLVAVGPSPLSARLVRATRRLAASLHAEWRAVAVETPGRRQGEAARSRVVQTLRLAEQLGAETATLSGERVSNELLSYARAHNVTKIIVGKPDRPRWQELLFGSVVDELVRKSGKIDVYVITGDDEAAKPSPLQSLNPTSTWDAYLRASGVVLICTLLAWLIYPYFHADELSNLVMIYLLGIVVAATRYGRGPSTLASLLSVAAFDFFFVPPYNTFSVSDTRYLVTFVVMFVVGVVISNLTARIRWQAQAARRRERRTAALYAMTRELASTRGLDNLVSATLRHIGEVFESQVAVLLPDGDKRLQPQGETPTFAREEAEQGVAQWVFDRHQMAGLGTNTLSGAAAIYLPLNAAQSTVGVLGVQPQQPDQLLDPEQFHLLETFANQTALAIERAQLGIAAADAQITAETERLRASLLSTVSHDLRTPLAVITGALSSLIEGGPALDASTRDELARTGYVEAERLNKLLSNLLDMTKLEAGAVQLAKEWQPLEEVVGAVLNRLEPRLAKRQVAVDLPADLPPVPIDETLIEQVLINLLENALAYTPPGTPLAIAAQAEGDGVVVSVADRGPGLRSGDEQRIFDKFYRANRQGGRDGVGLGLTICRGIVEAHGGRIWAENRAGGGAIFRFLLPLNGKPPLPAAAAAQRGAVL
jgi:two-component system, OmpR family, sensor histidine kinase KdpD